MRNDDTDQSQISARNLISIFQTGPMRTLASQPLAVFEQMVEFYKGNLKLVSIVTITIMIPILYWLILFYICELSHKRHSEYLNQPMWVGPGMYDYYWNHSIGNVILGAFPPILVFMYLMTTLLCIQCRDTQKMSIECGSILTNMGGSQICPKMDWLLCEARNTGEHTSLLGRFSGSINVCVQTRWW